MKISLALGPRQTLSRQTAWGCLTTNLALPGFGSLVAGRPSGYLQAVLAVGGMALTALYGVRFIAWYLANWSRLLGDQADPFSTFGDLWLKLRWVLLSFFLFGLGWFWALLTSLAIVREAKKGSLPPALKPPVL